MMINSLLLLLFTASLCLGGVTSALLWSPPCPHQCLCRDASASSTTTADAGWKASGSEDFKTAICVQQHDTDFDALLSLLPPQTEAIKIIQASDAPEIRLKSGHFRSFSTSLRILSLEGSARNNLTVLLHSDSLKGLGKLQYLSLERVEILDDPSQFQEEIPNKSQEKLLSYKAQEDGSQLSNGLIPDDETDDNTILPYEEFKKLQRQDGKSDDLWDGFTPLSELETLRLVGCKLPEAFTHGESAAFSGLIRLKDLIVRSSGLRVNLGTSSGDLKALESLSLADNELLDMDDLQGMEGLRSLDLSGNHLTTITDKTLPALAKLESLDLTGNPIQDLFSNAFAKFSSLRRLRMGSPASAIQLRRGSLNGLTLLQELTMTGVRLAKENGLEADYLKDLTGLTELRISGGSFKSIEADTFATSRRLQTLDLSRNGIRRLSVDAFQFLGKLRALDLSGNELNQLPPGLFDPLRSIKELWLQRNRLAVIPADIFFGVSNTAKLIRLEGNPWDCTTCQLSRLRPTSINKIKVLDRETNSTWFQYDRRVAPLCATPAAFRGVSVFDAMRSNQLKCSKVQLLPMQEDVWNDPMEPVDHGAEAPPPPPPSSPYRPKATTRTPPRADPTPAATSNNELPDGMDLLGRDEPKDSLSPAVDRAPELNPGSAPGGNEDAAANEKRSPGLVIQPEGISHQQETAAHLNEVDIRPSGEKKAEEEVQQLKKISPSSSNSLSKKAQKLRRKEEEQRMSVKPSEKKTKSVIHQSQ